jgi:hypothetical protein
MGNFLVAHVAAILDNVDIKKIRSIGSFTFVGDEIK